MAITNTLNTRIALKYDTLENWMSNAIGQDPLILKKGEIAIAEINNHTINGDGAQTNLNTPPAIAMKVGDGTKTFAQLPWVQAVAGDVYAWAKKANAPKLSELTEIDAELAEMVGEIIGNHDEIQDHDTFYKVGEEKAADGTHKFVLHAYDKDGVRLQDTTKDIEIDWSDLDTWMAEEADRVQDLIDSALSTLKSEEIDITGEGKFVSSVTQDGGKIVVTRSKLVADDITDIIPQAKVADLPTLQSNFNTVKGHVDAAEGTVSATNKLMTKSAVQADIETAVGALDDKIVVTQNDGNYVTGVERNAEGTIVVTRDTLTHEKIGDWDTAVTNKLDLKVNKADLFYSDDTAPSATNYIVRKEDIDGLAHGLHFRGFVESDPTAWAEPTNNPDTADVNEEYIAGDIVIREVTVKETIDDVEKEYVTTLEYIFDGAEWKELGSEGFHATKASVDALSASLAALDKKHDEDKAEIDEAIEEAIKSAGGNADVAIETALDKLDLSKADGAAKFATSVTQKDGQIAVEYAGIVEADIPPEMSTGKIKGLQDHMDDTNAHFNAAIGASGAAGALVDATNPLVTKAYADEVATGAAEAEVAELKTALEVTKTDTAKFATVVEQKEGKIEVTYTNIVAADITDTVPTDKLTDGTAIAAVISNVEGGTAALSADNKLATKTTVEAAVEAGVGALDAQLKPIAKSGNVNDLVQTAGDVIFFNCGSTTTVI